jgi:hypothetical protein
VTSAAKEDNEKAEKHIAAAEAALMLRRLMPGLKSQPIKYWILQHPLKPPRFYVVSTARLEPCPQEEAFSAFSGGRCFLWKGDTRLFKRGLSIAATAK